MSEKKKRDGEMLDVDIRSFEEEIDREIDSLFTVESLKDPGEEEVIGSISLTGRQQEKVPWPDRSGGTGSPGIEVSLPGKKGDVDLGVFEDQIEREIDALFIPSTVAPSPETMSPRQEATDRGAFGKGGFAGLDPPAGSGLSAKPSIEKNLSDDLGSFEQELDAGIDSLFVPASQSVREETKGAREGGVPADRFPTATPPAAAAERIPGMEAGGSTPTAFRGSMVGFAGEAAIPELQKPADFSSLLESFSIAYLSLEWDFSGENIEKFSSVLGSLEPYCQKDPSAQSLHRLLKSVLHRLKTKPDSIDAELGEMIHDGQDLLRSVLISEGAGPRDKERLKVLIRKFQLLREKALAGRKPEERMTPAGPISIPEIPDREASAAVVGDNAATFDLPGLKSLLERIESYRILTEEGVQGVAAESKNLLQIEGILSKTPGLAPLKAHIGRIRSSLDVHVSSLLSRGSEWRDRMLQFQELTKCTEGQTFALTAQAAGGLETPAALNRSDAPIATFESRAASREIRKDDVCLFDVSGRHFAVLASQVVKVQRVSAGMARKLTKRGYATLTDFKPFFRSVKAGVFGTWSGMPDQILRKYRFVALPPDILHLESIPGGGGALLVSSGRNHGLIFIDTAEVDLHNETEIVVDGPKDQGILGVIKPETGETVEVLNLDAILRKLQGQEEQ